MIQMADVGFGICAQEGCQVVMASDFAMSSFALLRDRLLRTGAGTISFFHIYYSQEQQVEDELCNYIIRGTPGGIKYFGELEEHCFWGNEVKLYECYVDKLFAMLGHKEPRIDYYVCTINKTFAKPSQRMKLLTDDTRTKSRVMKMIEGYETVTFKSKFNEWPPTPDLKL